MWNPPFPPCRKLRQQNHYSFVPLIWQIGPSKAQVPCTAQQNTNARILCLYCAKKRKKKIGLMSQKFIVKSYLATARIFQIPKLDVSVTHGDEIIAVFREADSFYFARNFIGCYFNVVPPIPNVDDHIVLRADRHDILVAWRKRLRQKTKNIVFVHVRELFGNQLPIGFCKIK